VISARESNFIKRSKKGVDRSGYPFSDQIWMSRAPSAPRSGFALDNQICSEATVAVANRRRSAISKIDGAARSVRSTAQRDQ
jgi:hypothetical protein